MAAAKAVAVVMVEGMGAEVAAAAAVESREEEMATTLAWLEVG